MGQATAAAVVVVGSTVYSSSRSSSSSYRRECLGLKFGNSETRLATDPRKQCKAIRASLPVGRRPWRSASKKKAIKHGQEHGKTYGCIQYTPQKRQGYIMVYSDIYIYIYVYIYIYTYIDGIIWGIYHVVTQYIHVDRHAGARTDRLICLQWSLSARAKLTMAWVAKIQVRPLITPKSWA